MEKPGGRSYSYLLDLVPLECGPAAPSLCQAVAETRATESPRELGRNKKSPVNDGGFLVATNNGNLPESVPGLRAIHACSMSNGHDEQNQFLFITVFGPRQQAHGFQIHQRGTYPGMHRGVGVVRLVVL